MEEEDKPLSLHGNSTYSPEVQKMLRGWKDTVFGPGHNEVLKDFTPPEDDRKEVTWKYLHENYKYEKPAHGYKLVGDITQRDKNNWEYHKHVKLRDRDGTEHAVFFYVDNPNKWNYEDMEVGGLMVINSPRLHRFMDGQDGMRLDEERMVQRVIKQPLTDTKRLDYSNLMRENGNRKFKEEKFEDAIEYYESSVSYVQGSSFVDGEPDLKNQALERELKCNINIASATYKLKNYSSSITHCHKALALNPNSAMAYYRMGLAHAGRGEDKSAVTNYKKAIELSPQDPSVSVQTIKKELGKSSTETTSQQKSMKNLFSGFLNTSKFGVKKASAALSGGKLPSFQTIINHRDLIGGISYSMGKPVKGSKWTIFRSGTAAGCSTADRKLLIKDYGIKTIIDLRTTAERETAVHDQKDFPLVIKAEEIEGKIVESIPLSNCTEQIVLLNVDLVDKLNEESLSMTENIWVAFYSMIYQKETALSLQYARYENKTPGAMLRDILDERGVELTYVLRILSDPSNHPVLISDSHGKDAVAVLSVLILGCLGVTDDDILEDFMKSQSSIPDNHRKKLATHWASLNLSPTFAYIDVDDGTDLIDFINGRYDGIPAYLSYMGFGEEEQVKLRRACIKD